MKIIEETFLEMLACHFATPRPENKNKNLIFRQLLMSEQIVPSFRAVKNAWTMWSNFRRIKTFPKHVISSVFFLKVLVELWIPHISFTPIFTHTYNNTGNGDILQSQVGPKYSCTQHFLFRGGKNATGSKFKATPWRHLSRWTKTWESLRPLRLISRDPFYKVWPLRTSNKISNSIQNGQLPVGYRSEL